jgi:hypothetical protein
MTKKFDIELIFQLVNKKESLQQVNATKSDPNFQTILYLVAGEGKSTLCCGSFHEKHWRTGVMAYWSADEA